MPGTFELSVAALDILGRQLGLNLRLIPLEIPALAKTVEEQRAIGEAVWRTLHRQGLARDGRLDPDVETALVTLANPQVALSLMLGTNGGRSGTIGRAGGTPRAAVLATQRGETVRFQLAPPNQLVAMLMSVIPDCPALPRLRYLSIPREAPKPAPSDDDDAGDEGYGGSIMIRPAASTVGNRDKAAVQRILALPKQRVGAVKVIGRGGELVTWTDTTQGRFIELTQRQRDGAVWNVYEAGDNRELGGQIGNAISAVSR
ncbi:MAG TPA: ESX secretion-associated protein EspG [Pseudonocardiaceae bacterium]